MYKKLNLIFLNLFTDKAVFQPAYRQKAVFQPGSSRPKPYKGEMRRMRRLYICILLSMCCSNCINFFGRMNVCRVFIYFLFIFLCMNRNHTISDIYESRDCNGNYENVANEEDFLAQKTRDSIKEESSHELLYDFDARASIDSGTVDDVFEVDNFSVGDNVDNFSDNVDNFSNASLDTRSSTDNGSVDNFSNGGSVDTRSSVDNGSVDNFSVDDGSSVDNVNSVDNAFVDNICYDDFHAAPDDSKRNNPDNNANTTTLTTPRELGSFKLPSNSSSLTPSGSNKSAIPKPNFRQPNKFRAPNTSLTPNNNVRAINRAVNTLAGNGFKRPNSFPQNKANR